MFSKSDDQPIMSVSFTVLDEDGAEPLNTPVKYTVTIGDEEQTTETLVGVNDVNE